MLVAVICDSATVVTGIVTAEAVHNKHSCTFQAHLAQLGDLDFIRVVFVGYHFRLELL